MCLAEMLPFVHGAELVGLQYCIALQVSPTARLPAEPPVL
jgi:hypothetical protein